VDQSTFDAMVARGEFLEHATVFGNSYGTSRREVEKRLRQGKAVLLDIDWQGGRQVRSQMPDALGIFILPPSAEELERRLLTRGQDSTMVIGERMQKARAEMSHWSEYDYLLINEKFDEAVQGLATILTARQLAREVQGRRHAGLIQSLLGP
jgi:guanylate kinase